nr:carboxyl transferase domain-containing protein [Pseudarthrobacter psychrotolerans]
MTTLAVSGIRPDSRAILDVVLDSGTFNSWDEDPGPSKSLLEGYAQTLERTREKTGHTEAVITGRGDIHGLPVAVIVSEFAFLAGSMGVHASKRVHDAISRATSEGLPVIACPASGGTRMQEGTSAFVQMLKITAAIETHKAQGLPYLVYLRHPTTGGSWRPGDRWDISLPQNPKPCSDSSDPKSIKRSTGLHSRRGSRHQRISIDAASLTPL